MKNSDFYTLIFTGFALLVAFLALFQQIYLRTIDKRKKELDSKMDKMNHKISNIKSISTQQYKNLTEHINDNFNIVSDIISDHLYERDGNLLSQQLQEYQNESIVRLRKIEMASFSAETQKESIMFFAGNTLGGRPDVIDYTRTLLETNIIHNNNIELATRILRQVN